MAFAVFSTAVDNPKLVVFTKDIPMKAKCALALTFLISSGAVNAENSGYASITEIKSWDTKHDIYLSVSHNCGGPGTTHYHLPKDDNQKYALLLSSFVTGMVVNLAYTCQADGYPLITGVRARKVP